MYICQRLDMTAVHLSTIGHDVHLSTIGPVQSYICQQIKEMNFEDVEYVHKVFLINWFALLLRRTLSLDSDKLVCFVAGADPELGFG